MKIAKGHEHFIEMLKSGERRTLKDSRTALYIKSAGDGRWVIKADNGIIPYAPNEKKSDYIVYEEYNARTHVIELKGSVIKNAYMQIMATHVRLKEYGYEYLVEGIKSLDAYIVTKGRMTFPRGANTIEKELARFLYNKSKNKVKNMFDLINYVEVISGIKNCKTRLKPSGMTEGKRMQCSNDNPIVF